MPLFSLIIPTYNRAHLIGKTIASVLNQTFSDFEVIVVDDGSSDDTKGVVSLTQDARLRYVWKPNGERGAARNAGVALAIGDYVTFLDSDDLLYANHFSLAAEFLKARQRPVLFHMGYEIVNPEGHVLKKIDRLRDINHELITGNPLSCMGVFVKSEVMRAHLFIEDRTLAGLEDWELWLRMGARYPIIACRQVTSALVQHDDRSVLEANAEKLISKMTAFVRCVNADEANQKNYSAHQLKKIIASAMTYTALHLALASEKPKAWFYLKEGCRNNLMEIFRKRSMVILKILLLS